MTTQVCNILVSLLEQAHLNEAELARRTNLPKATINRITSGRTPDPRSSTLIPIAEYFHISVDQLMGKKPMSPLNSNTPQEQSTVISIQEDLLKEILDKALTLDHSSITSENFSRFLFEVISDMATLDASIEIKRKMLEMAISSASFFNQEKSEKMA